MDFAADVWYRQQTVRDEFRKSLSDTCAHAQVELREKGQQLHKKDGQLIQAVDQNTKLSVQTTQMMETLTRLDKENMDLRQRVQASQDQQVRSAQIQQLEAENRDLKIHVSTLEEEKVAANLNIQRLKEVVARKDSMIFNLKRLGIC